MCLLAAPLPGPPFHSCPARPLLQDMALRGCHEEAKHVLQALASYGVPAHVFPPPPFTLPQAVALRGCREEAERVLARILAAPQWAECEAVQALQAEHAALLLQAKQVLCWGSQGCRGLGGLSVLHFLSES